MAVNYNTSINIIRDTESDFNYVPTPNGNQVVTQIVNDFKKGIHSFNIVGTYGTGKSSFLLALEKSIKGEKRYFEPNFINNPKVDFIKIIGSYNSIVDEFVELFDVTAKKNINENILSEIFYHYYALGKNGILFLLLDEFGKFLEYASKNNPENELYFIQQLAEFCNNPKHSIVLITTIHQGFDSYAYSLNSTKKQEWTKVKGRFREITFNEPVEQLLYLASKHFSNTLDVKKNVSAIKKCLNLSIETKAFDFNQDYLSEIATKLYPLDIISANVLTLALQKYGQNERSLFSFLESTDHTSIAKYNKQEHPFYNLSCVYDYLIFNFYSFLTSKYNPDFSTWSSIRLAIEDIERVFDHSINDYLKTIKIIGLLNIFSAKGCVLDRNFLSEYLKYGCGVLNGGKIIQQLESKNVIRFRNHSKRFILFEGTDLDIQTALIEAGNKISEISDVSSLLNKHFRFSHIIGKLYSYERGTPRFFKFVISEYPIIDQVPQGEVDGFINLVFNHTLNLKDVQEVSKKQKEAVVYCFFENSDEIKNLLFEIEKIHKVIDENSDDKVAKLELENIADSQKRLLNHYIFDNIYKSINAKWVFNGQEKQIANKREFNKLLSQICFTIYDATPIFKNELVNKHKISLSIHTAKKRYFKALANNWDKEDLGFSDSKYPPEKTIYLSLLQENSISPIRKNDTSKVYISEDFSFYKLWKASEQFIESAKSEQKSVSDFVGILNKRPFKLKQGLIDFWIPTFLFLKRNDFAIFNDESYIPYLSEENLQLISKYPEDYTIKTFDVEGVKLDVFNSYRVLLNQSSENEFNNSSFIETIKPFIVFYKQLSDYSKYTKRLSPQALAIRKAISNSKDPEDTFFDAFPSALGTTLNNLQEDTNALQNYTINLQAAIKELRTSYYELIKRFEDFISNEFVGKDVPFDEYKSHFQNRFSTLKKHLLLSNQKTFVQRIDSALDDKKLWLNSIAQSITGKTLDVFIDEDEMLLYEKFEAMVLELDGLSVLSRFDIDDKNEDVIRIKMDTFSKTIAPKIVRIPKKKNKEIERLKFVLKENLGRNKTSNIVAVSSILKELLK
ncbi:MAG: hypothetical protein OXC03_04360 [Flavobacteriaceae bacterium]|nr:hypothetical protein [Flavobacteriaceae bacterium]